MKRMHDTTHFHAFKAGLMATAILLAAATHAGSAPQARQPAVLMGQRAETIPLPPIASLDAVPWLQFERAPKGPRIDLLLSPVPSSLWSALTMRNRLPMWPDGLLAAGTTPRNG